jgi:hypothetical protein
LHELLLGFVELGDESLALLRDRVEVGPRGGMLELQLFVGALVGRVGADQQPQGAPALEAQREVDPGGREAPAGQRLGGRRLVGRDEP